MTVSSAITRADYRGNNVTTLFTVPFYFLDQTHIKVLRTDNTTVPPTVATLVLNSDYVTTGAGVQIGGQVQTTVAPTAAQTLTILRNVPFTQLIHYVPNDPFPAATHEQALDQLTMEVQELGEQVSHSIQFPTYEPAPGALAPAGTRAGTVLGFDSSGNLTYLPAPPSVGAGDLRTDTFLSGAGFTPGATTQFTLSRPYNGIANLTLHFDGTYQGPENIASVVNGVATLTAPVPVGITSVYFTGGTSLSVGTPGAQSVVDASVASGSRLYNRVFSTVDIKDFGALGNGVSDDTAALVAALAFAQAHTSAKITIPAGKFKFSALATYTFPTATAALTIEGAGDGVTELSWSNGDGLKFNYISAFNSLILRGMTLSTATTGAGNGVLLNQTATSIPDPGNSALNLMEDLVFQGADGQKQVQYWGTAINVFGVSNINFNDVQGCGPLAFYSTSGTGVSLNGSAALPSVVYNFKGCTFNLLNVGVLYGNWVQGVSFSQTNFTGGAIGIAVPAGITGTDQLYVGGCQFNCITGVNILSATESMSIIGNLFIVPQGGEAINLAFVSMTAIVGNTFGPSTYSTTAGYGVVIGQTVLIGATITGNGFYHLPSDAILLQANSSANNVQSNIYGANGANVVNLGTGNTVGGGSQ